VVALGCLGVVLTLCAGWAGAAAQESLDKVDALHVELVGKAERILTDAGAKGAAEARALLEKARSLRVKTPGGELVYRSAEPTADYYFAWILCRSTQPKDPERGAQLFREILQNRTLSPHRLKLANSELKKCQDKSKTAAASEAKVPVTFKEEGRLVISAVQKGGRGGSQPLYFPNPARLPRVSWGESAGAAAALGTLLGPRYRVVAAGPFLVAGKRPASYLDELAARVLKPYHGYLAARMGAPDGGVIFAVVAGSPGEVIELSQALYGAPPQASTETLYSLLAYSDLAARLMVAVCGKDPANCTSFAHELFHLLNSRMYEDAPWWLYEGAAELFESGDIVGGEFVPRVGWRKRDLVLKDTNAAGLEQLLGLSKNAAYAAKWPGPEAEMAKARFFAQFLHERGKLWKVYAAMRARSWDVAAEDPSGAKTLAEIDKPLTQLGTEFGQWVQRRVVPAKVRPGP
jgi:hypothetical protein